MRFFPQILVPGLLLAACNGVGEGVEPANTGAASPAGAQQAPAPPAGGQAPIRIVSDTASAPKPFQAQPVARFEEPWAMAFIPGTGSALITEKKGRLKLWAPDARVQDVAGVPTVAYGGQGGLGDVVLHPDFARNRLVYLSWVEAGEGETFGAVVGRARLVTEGANPRLEGMQVIWRQDPKVEGRGHFGHRLAFGPDGHLFISNGERQKFDPAQDMGQTLGKIVRLNADGSVPRDNPFAGRGGVAAQIWTLGHRNPLGIAFDRAGNFWSHEMGPRHGDELNLILPGRNYGYPIVSEGDHYDGKPIPDHATRPEFEKPRIAWVPAISPAGMIIYDGSMFPQWRGSALLGGLSGQALVRVALDGTRAGAVERWDMGARIREVEQGPDGAVYLLEDERNNSGGRLLKLIPAR